MKLSMNIYAPRERAALSSKTPTDVSFIEPLKVVVARKHAPDEWDRRYFIANVIGNALVKLQDMNTCTLPEWTWMVPGTPVRIFHNTGAGAEPRYVFPVAHPKAAEQYLELIWNRARQELVDAIAVLKEAGFTGLADLSITSDDVNQRFYTLRWNGIKFPNTQNVIYIHRGNDKPLRKRSRSNPPNKAKAT